MRELEWPQPHDKGERLRWLKWIVALVLVALIAYICIAPSVDLPLTALRGILYAAFVMAMLHCAAKCLQGRARACLREFNSVAESHASVPPGLCYRSFALRC